MSDITQEELSEGATIRRLTGDTGVFVGDADVLASAKLRWEAMSAYSAGSATPSQVALLQDLDRVMQGSPRTQQAVPSRAPPMPAPLPPPALAPRPTAGMPRPPQRSKKY